jgi:hypothetical protein
MSESAASWAAEPASSCIYRAMSPKGQERMSGLDGFGEY